MGTVRGMRAAATVAALAVCVAACSSGGASSGRARSGSPSPSASSHGGHGKSAKQVLAQAKSALFNAKSVHVTGTKNAHGHTEELDFRFQALDCTGTLRVGGMTVSLIKTGGQVYEKAPAGFWAKIIGAKAPALAGKSIKASAAQAAGAGSLTLQGIAASLNAEDSPLQPRSTHATVDGKQALKLTQKNGSMLYVAAATPPLPLRIVNTGTDRGRIDFTDYNQTQHITAPAGAVTAKQALRRQHTTA